MKLPQMHTDFIGRCASQKDVPLVSHHACIKGLIICMPNAGHQARREVGARHERTLEAVACRVEPVVSHPAPPQTRTCAMNAYGSSVTRVLARLWRITVLPCIASQMLWTILGMGRI